MNAVSLSLLSVAAVSVISLIGALTISVVGDRGTKSPLIILFISLAIGALIGDVFIHLLPEAYEYFGQSTATYVLLGFFLFFLLEKVLHWRHRHKQSDSTKIEPYGIMNLVGDAMHNFIDGALIAASYLVSLPVGLATTIAVILHEIPQELGDYAILRESGFTKKAALGLNFLSALIAFLGAAIVLVFRFDIEALSQYVLAFTAGGFVYIVFILIKEFGDEIKPKNAFTYLFGIALGVALMWLITFVE
ncbi:ZIP family metal transporter [Candidatus Berkelbacteria bacterium]|nr:ZIP family metal transporter [Candidatus Berkelbacteria bacterium]